MSAKTDFMGNPRVCTAKGGSGRAQQVPRAAAAQEGIHKVFKRYLVHIETVVKTAVSIATESSLPAPDRDSLVDAMQAAVYGIEKNTTHYGGERHLFGSIRLPLCGTRQLACARFEDVYRFMAGEKVRPNVLSKADNGDSGGEGGEILGYDVDAVAKYFRFMTGELLEKFLANHPVFFGTLPPHECCILPPAFVYIENVMTDDHVYGIKIGYLPKTTSSADLFAALAWRYGGSRDVSLMSSASRCFNDGKKRELQADAKEGEGDDEGKSPCKKSKK